MLMQTAFHAVRSLYDTAPLTNLSYTDKRASNAAYLLISSFPSPLQVQMHQTNFSPLSTTMSAWTDIVNYSPTAHDTRISWKEYLHTSIKAIAISLIAMALSTFVMIVMKQRWQSSPGMWELFLACACSGVVVSGADWYFGISEIKSHFAA